MTKAGNLKLDFVAKSIGIHFFKFEDMFICYRDSENLKKHFGHMDTLTTRSSVNGKRFDYNNDNENLLCNTLSHVGYT